MVIINTEGRSEDDNDEKREPFREPPRTQLRDGLVIHTYTYLYKRCVSEHFSLAKAPFQYYGRFCSWPFHRLAARWRGIFRSFRSLWDKKRNHYSHAMAMK